MTKGLIILMRQPIIFNRIANVKDETINHRKREYDWVGKVIHWELCKKLKFDHSNKWYMHNPESVLENETHELFWDFEIQTDHQISARRPELIVINKKKENL